MLVMEVSINICETKENCQQAMFILKKTFDQFGLEVRMTKSRNNDAKLARKP